MCTPLASTWIYYYNFRHKKLGFFWLAIFFFNTELNAGVNNQELHKEEGIKKLIATNKVCKGEKFDLKIKNITA